MAGKYAILLLGDSHGIGLTFHFTRLAVALESAGNRVVVLSGGRKQYKELSDELDERRIPCYISYGLNNMSPLSIAKAVSDIRKTLEKEGPFDFILGGGIRDGLRLFLANKRVKASIKTFSVICSLPRSAIGMKLAYLSYNHFYYSDIALCNYTRDMLQKVV